MAPPGTGKGRAGGVPGADCEDKGFPSLKTDRTLRPVSPALSWQAVQPHPSPGGSC